LFEIAEIYGKKIYVLSGQRGPKRKMPQFRHLRTSQHLLGRLHKSTASAILSAIRVCLGRQREFGIGTHRRSLSRPNRRILYVQFGDPAAYPPIEHSAHILAERDWDVILLGTDSYRVQNLKLANHPKITVRILSLAKARGQQSFQYVYFSFWLFYFVWTWRPAWIYASDPLVSPAIWLIRKFTKARIIYHEHDSPVSAPARSWFMRAALSCRNKIAKNAELCIIPQKERLISFLAETGRQSRTICVWNCPRLGSVQFNFNNKDSQNNNELIMYYHGSINCERLPKELIAAASRFKGAVRFRIVGYEAPGSVGYINALVEFAADNGAPGIIEFLGSVPHENLFQYAANAHVGLSLMPRRSNDINMQHMVGASNKPFEYMAFGLPLLVTDLPEWNLTFVVPGYARACDPENIASLVAELNWYLTNPVERRNMGRRSADKIRQSWNYDTMFAEVLTILESN
jgi:glycosyltransferase involved in cell wall biosynthesis